MSKNNSSFESDKIIHNINIGEIYECIMSFSGEELFVPMKKKNKKKKGITYNEYNKTY